MLLLTIILFTCIRGAFPYLLTAVDLPDKAQMVERGEYLSIKILTIGQDDPVYLWYGHIAIVVEDSLRDTEILYDFGVFSFKQDNFYRNFTMGRLIYGVVAAPTAYRISLAKLSGRNIMIATLDIPPEKRYETAIFLQNKVKPGNNTYLYHHYYDNCSTRIRDVINMAVDGQLETWAVAKPGRMTYRDHIRRYSGNHFFMDWVLNFLQSGVIDKPITLWDDMFLPDELNANLLNFHYIDSSRNSVKLVSKYEILSEFPERGVIPSEPAEYWPAGIAVGLLAGIAGLVLCLSFFRTGKTIWRIAYGTYSALYGLLFGTLGTVLLFMMILTNHDVTFSNENVLIASPLLLWIGILGILIAAGKKKFFRLQKLLFTIQGLAGLILLILKLIASGVFYQQNWLTLSILIPSLLIMSRFWMRERN